MLLYNMLPDCDNSGAPEYPLWLFRIMVFAAAAQFPKCAYYFGCAYPKGVWPGLKKIVCASASNYARMYHVK
jgi:hypothetical protein